MKKQVWKAYALWIILAEAVGALSGWVSRNGTKIYSTAIVQPPLSPPGIVFPIVWSILFALMGVSAARVFLAPEGEERTRGLRLFFTQLGFNFFWSVIFFNMQAFGLAFLWLAALWALIVWMTVTFYRVDRPAAWLQLPYLIWVAFAGYLNLGVWRLN